MSNLMKQSFGFSVNTENGEFASAMFVTCTSFIKYLA